MLQQDSKAPRATVSVYAKKTKKHAKQTLTTVYLITSTDEGNEMQPPLTSTQKAGPSPVLSARPGNNTLSFRRPKKDKRNVIAFPIHPPDNNNLV